MYTCKEGFNCKEIDLWSVGVVVYKLTTGKMPVTYSKCFKSDIKHEWPTALNFFINQFGRGEWSMVENMLVQMALLFMKVKPEDRLNLKMGIKILDKI
jgi:serine/threonine protein kinase